MRLSCSGNLTKKKHFSTGCVLPEQSQTKELQPLFAISKSSHQLDAEEIWIFFSTSSGSCIQIANFSSGYLNPEKSHTDFREFESPYTTSWLSYLVVNTDFDILLSTHLHPIIVYSLAGANSFPILERLCTTLWDCSLLLSSPINFHNPAS